MAKTKVLVVDDQQMARQLFSLYIESCDKYELAGALSSAAQAESFLSHHAADCIIMDVLMQDDSNGLTAAENIKKKWPGIRTIIVTSMIEASWMKRAQDMGIESFWYKGASQETILGVLDRTMAGEHVYPDAPPKVTLGLAGSEEFTERELEVLRLMTAGMSNAKIAERLNISGNTVKSHIAHMLDKTGCENRTQLAIEARVRGIVVNLD